jgi:hypothetical protein
MRKLVTTNMQIAIWMLLLTGLHRGSDEGAGTSEPMSERGVLGAR